MPRFWKPTSRTAPPRALSTPSFTREDYDRLAEIDARERQPTGRNWHSMLAGLCMVMMLASGLLIFGGLMVGPALASPLLQFGALGLGVLVGIGAVGLGKLHDRGAGIPLRPPSTLADKVLAEVGQDPMGWPAWSLHPHFAVLHAPALTAASRYLHPDQIAALKAQWHKGGTVGEQIALLRNLPLPEIERVTVTHVERVVETAPAPEPAPSASERLDSLKARHHQLSAEYGLFLTDPASALKWPVLNDVTDPRTAKFVEDYAALSSLPDAPSDLTHYELVLSRAWRSWRTAHAHAKKVGLKSLTGDEKKRVRRATKLLEMAMNSGASDAERALAYTQVQKLVSGLVTLPEPARAAVEASVRPALTARESLT